MERPVGAKKPRIETRNNNRMWNAFEIPKIQRKKVSLKVVLLVGAAIRTPLQSNPRRPSPQRRKIPNQSIQTDKQKPKNPDFHTKNNKFFPTAAKNKARSRHISSIHNSPLTTAFYKLLAVPIPCVYALPIPSLLSKRPTSSCTPPICKLNRMCVPL